MNRDTIQTDLMTPTEAANYLRISKPKLWKLRDAGKLPTIKLGAKSPRFRKSDLDAFIESCTEAIPAA